MGNGTIPPNSGPPSTIFGMLPPAWRNTATKIVYIGVDGSYWNLAGNYAGKEGLTLAPHLAGLMHVPFKSIFSEGPYQVGGVYERTDYLKRQISCGVQVGVDYGPDTSSWRYRMLEQKWWRAWSAEADGYLGCYTRTHGWRFLRVRLAEEPKTPFEIEPTAFDNNFMQWDMVIVALQPYWQKKMQTASWANHSSTSTALEDIENLLENIVNQFLGALGLLSLEPNDGLLQPGKDIGSTTFTVWNNGDQKAWPKFLVSAPGQAWIQDGVGGNMIPLPLLTAADGTCLVDTDPTARTLTCATDPIDPLWYQILSNSSLIDVVLNAVGINDTPIWQQFQYFFTTAIAPNTLANLKVYHSDPTGTVTMLLPQQFDKAYG